MTKPITFTRDGARRIVAATRAYEAGDPLYTGPKPRRTPRGDRKHEYIVGRVTAVNEDDYSLHTVTEQYWSDADAAFIDIPGGRVWDGDGLPQVWAATLPSVGDVVVIGHRYGPNDSHQWYVVPGGTWTFHAKITGSTSLSTNRWKYAWTEVTRTATAWADTSGGRSGTTTTNFALNGMEANNDGTGIQGNGVDIDGTIFTDNTGLAIQPIQGSPVVAMEGRLVDGVLMFTFFAVNAVDGECG